MLSFIMYKRNLACLLALILPFELLLRSSVVAQICFPDPSCAASQLHLWVKI